MTAGKSALETGMGKCSRHPTVGVRFARVLCRMETSAPR